MRMSDSLTYLDYFASRDPLMLLPNNNNKNTCTLRSSGTKERDVYVCVVPMPNDRDPCCCDDFMHAAGRSNPGSDEHTLLAGKLGSWLAGWLAAL